MELKIVCECGQKYAFDVEPVGGRMPVAVNCPACQADGTATANMCPTLVKQGRDAAATMDANSDKVKKAVSMLDKAEALHKEGKHADSVKQANEALDLLGVKK